MKNMKDQNAKTVLKKDKVVGLTLLDIKILLYYKAVIIKTYITGPGLGKYTNEIERRIQAQNHTCIKT